MLRDSLVGLIETMWLGAEVRLSRSQKTYRIGRPLCLENPRPEGAECSLAESDASPFHAEPEQVPETAEIAEVDFLQAHIGRAA